MSRHHPRKRPGLIRRLLTAAGSSRGRDARDRGTILLMVVGVLAMMSIVAVVYVTIGQSDRRGAAALVRENRFGDQAANVRDYIAAVIAADLFSTFKDPHAEVRWRETTDIPSISDEFVSDPTGGGIPFDPTGDGTGTDPWLSAPEPTYLHFFGRNIPNNIDYSNDYLLRRDWAVISNLAPNGRFVNLANLRGNFAAEAGIAQQQMSYGLTLYNMNSGRLYTVGTSQLPDTGEQADPNKPAHWTLNQVHLYRPAFEVDPRADAPGVGDYNFAPYQFADADGDGKFDSRWFALTRFTDDDNNERWYFPELPDAGPMRLFVAARVIDLSGLVNVNTARDFRSTPSVNHGVGVYPSEIDLLRLLTGQDAFRQYGENYDGYVQPSFGQALPGNGDYDNGRYTANHMTIGQAGYFVLRKAFDEGSTPPPGTVNTTSPPTPPPARAPLTAEERRRHYAEYGFDLGVGVSESPAAVRFSRPFGVSDELELRTYHGANDSTHLSRLEAAVGGRDQSARAPSEAVSAFCPLRSNRDLIVERQQRGKPTNPDGLARDQALLQAATDARRLLTVHSGARFLRPRPIIDGVNDSVLTNDDLREDADDLIRRALVPGDQQPRDLFYAYARALMPYSFANFPWPSSNNGWHLTPDAESTLFYGHRGAELALRSAAHLTANMMALAADRTVGDANPPRVPALVVSLRRDATEPTLHENYKWVNLDDAPDAPTTLLDPTNTNSTGEHTRIFPVSVQPFMTEAAMYLVFTDAPTSAGGDNEAEGLPPPFPPPPLIVTMSGKVDCDNPDFVMQVLAIQLHNPFQYPVLLNQYYFKYGQMTFTITGTETLAAGESRVVYSTNPGPDAIQARWDARGGGAQFRTWVTENLGGDALELARVHNGVVLPDSACQDMFKTAGQNDWVNANNADAPADRVIQMWRRFGDPTVETDDQLADRLRDGTAPGTRPIFDRRFNLANDQISGTVAGPEGAGAIDNTGYTIALYGFIRRPSDPSADPAAAASPVPLGAIPAYCLERKAGVGTMNSARPDSITSLNGLNRADFQDSTHAWTTFSAAVNAMTAGAFEDIALDKEPWQKNQAPVGLNRENKSYRDVYPEIHFRGNRFRSTTTPDHTLFRIGDMALPMIIGPSYTQGLPNIPNAHPEEAEWVTLSEALAMATGYDYATADPALPFSFSASPASMYHNFAEHVADRGHLRLDTFVPFVNNSVPANFTLPPDPDPTTQNILHPGLPIAMNVFDAFRPPQYGTISRLVPGVININTAPLAVMRLLPMLTPEPPTPIGTSLTGWLQANGTGRTAAGMNQTLYDHNTQRYDVAATAVAYRDKTRVFPRPPADPPAAPNYTVDFSDATSASDFGRGERNWIFGIREDRGFARVGEIMALQQRTQPNNWHQRPVFDWNNGADIDNAITRFGFADVNAAAANETSNARLGLDSVAYRDANGNPALDHIVNDYDEQLTIASAVLNSINVRSDVFCVWFVIHGYLPSDVEGLGDQEPLVPSVARRYVMVVDRSNVTRKGEKPQILLFQEVPY